MSENIQEIKLCVPNSDRTASTELTIRFVFDENMNVVRIEGSGPRHTYEGRLTLKGTALGLEASGETSLALAESGDHCVVCPPRGDCFVQVPCSSCD